MENNKENTDKENLKDKAENLKNSAEEFAKEAREKAETFTGKTMDAAEKLLNDLLGKKIESSENEEENTDPRDI